MLLKVLSSNKVLFSIKNINQCYLFFIVIVFFYYSCDLFSLDIVSHERPFYLTVKSYETPLKRGIKIEPRFLAHLTATASELLDLSFLSELYIFCGCSADPPSLASGTRVWRSSSGAI